MFVVGEIVACCAAGVFAPGGGGGGGGTIPAEVVAGANGPVGAATGAGLGAIGGATFFRISVPMSYPCDNVYWFPLIIFVFLKVGSNS